MGLFSQSDTERFHAKVEFIPFSDCHYWTGYADKHGYGRIGAGGHVYLAHRFAYALAHGAIPGGLEVRHRCDNPLCVNPAHLELGEHHDNMADMQRRCRQRLGERHPRAKLTDDERAELICLAAKGHPTGELAKRFGLSKSRVSMMRHGHVGPNHPAARLSKPTGRTDRRISDEAALAIYRRAHGGEQSVLLAAEFGVRPSFIADIKRGATYATVTGHRR